MTEIAFPRGGYKGSFNLGGYYAPGSIVKQGPFLFGTSTGAYVNPCVVEGNLGNGSDWSTLGSATQNGNTLVLIDNATGIRAGSLRQSVNSGWDKKLLVVDALVGPNGGADEFHFGIYDATATLSPDVTASPYGLSGRTGFYGAAIDIWNDQVSTCLNGTVGNDVGYNTSFENYQAPIETTRYFRYMLLLEESGANWDMTLYRSGYDGGTGAGAATRDNPGYITSWTVTKPSFTSWRFGIGAWSGGVASTMKVRNAYVVDRGGDWDVLSVLPHTPEMEAGFW